MCKFFRIPYGLSNTGNTFQRMIDQILGDLLLCFVYVDDILVFSTDLDTHVHHLHQVFELLCLQGLTIGLPKCVLTFSELEFLGHHVSSSGCSPLDKHTSTISFFQ